jgi:hypothetical protein
MSRSGADKEGSSMSEGERFRIYEPADCGKDGYPLAWHEELKDAVRELAGHRCVRCGHPYRKGENGNGEWSPCDAECSHGAPFRVLVHGQGIITVDEQEPADLATFRSMGKVYARWRILTVHHLNGDKRDCRWWNLASLCQRCHLTIQGRVRMEQVYPHEHSEWFKPYAAGYYAAVYLGEDLTREQTLERLDELLALELATAPPDQRRVTDE